MGAHWKTAMRDKGFDPKVVVDAPARLGVIEALVTLPDMKGATIGDPENCSGTRCLKRILGDTLSNKDIKGELYVFMGASRAIVAWRNQRGRQYGYRFMVNGLPDKQDRTMNVVGERVALRPLRPTAKTGKRQGTPDRKPAKNTPGRNSNVASVQSLAAQLRSMA